MSCLVNLGGFTGRNNIYVIARFSARNVLRAHVQEGTADDFVARRSLGDIQPIVPFVLGLLDEKYSNLLADITVMTERPSANCATAMWGGECRCWREGAAQDL